MSNTIGNLHTAVLYHNLSPRENADLLEAYIRKAWEGSTYRTRECVQITIEDYDGDYYTPTEFTDFLEDIAKVSEPFRMELISACYGSENTVLVNFPFPPEFWARDYWNHMSPQKQLN